MSSKAEETTSPVPETPQNHRLRKGWLATIGTLLFGILWLAPIIALLVLNFDGYITGASAGCMGYCNKTLDGSTVNNLESDSRNALGALQLVAKALEVWFALVVGFLVYDLTMLLASSRDGLPLLYLTSNVSFADVTATLGSWSFWTSMKREKRVGEANATHRTLVLYCFLSVIVLSCILANLMGPAVAVLLLPTFGLVDVTTDTGPVSVYFDRYQAADLPRDIEGCEAADLEEGRYSCTVTRNGIAPVDGLIGSLMEAGFPGVSWYYTIPFLYNTSNSISWSYSHQVLRNLAADRGTITTTGNWPTYAEYTAWLERKDAWIGVIPTIVSKRHYEHFRDSARTLLGRRGPVIGTHSHCRKNLARIEVSDDREVHCYSFPTREGPFIVDGDELYATPDALAYGFIANRPSDADGTTITKCVRIGSGWGASSPLHSDFSFENAEDTSPTVVDIYSTDRAIYLTPDNSDCTQKTKTDNLCDWEGMFSVDIPPEITNTSLNVMITEYAREGTTTPVVCETLAYLSHPTYQYEIASNAAFNLAFLSNPDRDPSTPPIRIHPDWILAGWSVDRSGTIPADRAASIFMFDAVEGTPELNLPEAGYVGANNMQTQAFNLALSLMPFSTRPAAPPDTDNAILLDASQQVTVWAYSLHSRTSTLGVVIAIAGCVAVVLWVFVALHSRTESVSLTQLLETALKQSAVGRPVDGRSLKECGEERILLVMDEKGRWPTYQA